MANNVSRIRRVRSISISFELDFSKNFLNLEKNRSYKFLDGSGKSLLNSRACSCGSVSKETGVIAENSFNFQRLPDEIKLKIFTYLNFKSMCNVMLVCKNWNSLAAQNSYLWSTFDYTEIPVCSNIKKKLHRDCTLLCYANYARRVKQFINFLNKMKPLIRHLKLSFDIGDPSDGWRDVLINFLKTCRFKELKSADINWTETPAKKNFLTRQNSATWSTGEYRDLKTRRRLRQRYFIWFFDLFTAVASNVVDLRLPFDWSEFSIEAFSRLTKLKRLELRKYFFFQIVSQESLDRLMLLIPSVEKLTFELWGQGSRGHINYYIQSGSLVELDVSESRGVYFDQMDLPELRVFKVSRNPVRWVLPSLMEQNVHIPCLFHVLRLGCPKLVTVNDQTLDPPVCRWREEDLEGSGGGELSPSISEMLFKNCYCPLHYDHTVQDDL